MAKSKALATFETRGPQALSKLTDGVEAVKLVQRWIKQVKADAPAELEKTVQKIEAIIKTISNQAVKSALQNEILQNKKDNAIDKAAASPKAEVTATAQTTSEVKIKESEDLNQKIVEKESTPTNIIIESDQDGNISAPAPAYEPTTTSHDLSSADGQDKPSKQTPPAETNGQNKLNEQNEPNLPNEQTAPSSLTSYLWEKWSALDSLPASYIATGAALTTFGAGIGFLAATMLNNGKEITPASSSSEFFRCCVAVGQSLLNSFSSKVEEVANNQHPAAEGFDIDASLTTSTLAEGEYN